MGHVADGTAPACSEPDPDLTWLVRNLPSEVPRIVFGIGETVAPGFMQAEARVYFLKILHRLAPQVSGDLLTAKGITLYQAFNGGVHDWARAIQAANISDDMETWDPDVANSRRRAFDILNRLNYCPERIAMDDAHEQVRRHIGEWQTRWNLADEWISDAGEMTLHFAAINADQNGLWDGQLFPDLATMYRSLHDCEPPTSAVLEATDEFRVIPPTPLPKLVDVPVLLDDMKDPALDDDGKIGTFDPRMDTEDEGVKRLMPELERRLRRALQSIVAVDLAENGATRPARRRKPTSFEWLVRYQVLQEDKGDIADADSVKRSTVHKAVLDAARLIGMKNLRKERSGRPPGRRDSGTRRRAKPMA